MALEHMTPVVLLTDAFVANGSAAFKLPNLADYPAITPPYVPEDLKGKWTPYMRAENGTRYWAVPGREGFTHILGGLEKDSQTGAISTNPENHDLMTRLRKQKIDNIQVPDLEVIGDVDDADLLIVGFGGTYGHLRAAMDELRAQGTRTATAPSSCCSSAARRRSAATGRKSSPPPREGGVRIRLRPPVFIGKAIPADVYYRR